MLFTNKLNYQWKFYRWLMDASVRRLPRWSYRSLFHMWSCWRRQGSLHPGESTLCTWKTHDNRARKRERIYRWSPALCNPVTILRHFICLHRSLRGYYHHWCSGSSWATHPGRNGSRCLTDGKYYEHGLCPLALSTPYIGSDLWVILLIWDTTDRHWGSKSMSSFVVRLAHRPTVLSSDWGSISFVALLYVEPVSDFE